MKTHLERLAQVAESLLLTTPPNFPPHGVGDFFEYLKLAGRLRGLSSTEIVGLVKIFTQSAAEFLDELVRIRAGESHARHRRRDRRQRRPALARNRLHPAAPLHGRRERPSRIVGLRARRHGRGIERHRRFGAQPGRGDPHQRAGRARFSCVEGRARGVVLKSGEEIAAASVASNLDPKKTFLESARRSAISIRNSWTAFASSASEGTSLKMNLALSGLPEFTALSGNPPGARGPQHRATMHLCP